MSRGGGWSSTSADGKWKSSETGGFSYNYAGSEPKPARIALPPKTAVGTASKSGGSVGQGASPSRSVGPGAAAVVNGPTKTSGPGAKTASTLSLSTKTKGTGTGPGNGAVNTGTAATKATGPGNRTVFSVPIPDLSDLSVLLPGNLRLYPDMRYPNVEDFWEPRYGEPGEWVGGIINMGVDAANTFAKYQTTWHPDSPAAILTNHFNGVASGMEKEGAVITDLIFGDAIARTSANSIQTEDYAGKGWPVVKAADDALSEALGSQFSRWNLIPSTGGW